MTVTLSTRVGLTRWSSDDDPWSREQIDANFGAIENLAVVATQGLNAARPAAGTQRAMYLATDAERVYVDDGDEWYELLVLGTGGTVAGGVNFTGTLTKAGVAVATTADTGANTTALADHLADTVDAHDASAISVVPTGDVAATDVQAAIAELASEKATGAALTAHTGAAAGAHAATAISYAGSTDLVATTVEAALDELDAEKLAKAGGTVTGLVTFNSSPALADGVDVTVGTGTGSKIGQAASKLGFFGATPIARPGTYTLGGYTPDRALAVYASDPESVAYTGAADGEAKLADLNTLRIAYENLRVFVEDLAGVVVGTATDLKTIGMFG